MWLSRKSRTRTLQRQPVFYGWVQVAITLVTGAFSTGAGIWGFSVFVKPMGDEFGWSRAAIYGVLTVRALVGGALGPFMGPLQDTRLGPRFFSIATTVTMAGSMMAMKWIDDLVLFYLIFGGLGALANFGSSEMMLSVVLPRWFVRKRGRAMGVGSLGTALGSLVFPFLITLLLSMFDWRDAWLALGVLTLVILGPLSLLVRTRPEDLGLLPDGDKEPPARPAVALGEITPRSAVERNFSGAEVLRLHCFWLLVLAACLTSLGMTGFHANWLPYFQDIGFTRAQGSLAITTYGICGISTGVFWGWFAERFPVNRLLGIQACLTGLSVLLFLTIDNKFMLILAAASHGLSVRGMLVMRPMMIASYFGREHLGAVNGIMRPFTTLISAGSPLFVAWLHDQRGSYVTAFWIIAVSWFIAGAALTLARTPQTRSPTAAVLPRATGGGA